MDPSNLEHQHLRSALEFAVLIVNEGRKRRPPIPHPSGMKKYLSMQRLPSAALGPLRRIIENDPEFRTRLATGAVPELVDPIGILWLTRPEGWEQNIAALVAAAEEAERAADTEAAARRERKRREAAEQAAARTRAEVLGLEARVAELTADLEVHKARVDELSATTAALRRELIERRNEARHANDRAAAAARRVEQLSHERDAAESRRSRAEEARDDVLADRVEASVEASQLAELTSLARDLAAQLGSVTERLVGERDSGRAQPQRRALALPGGVLGDSDAATEHLLRSGASVVIDGYNVSMSGWPGLALEEQRRVLLDTCENVARRYGADVTVVFDGADVAGATTDQRRLIRVVFSPEGVTADDVIRAEVDRLPAGRAVVVVTSDAEIVRDVRAVGANTVSSARFLTTARR
jgi:predicted RNA-binding protein with PIN domain